VIKLTRSRDTFVTTTALQRVWEHARRETPGLALGLEEVWTLGKTSRQTLVRAVTIEKEDVR
jgi:hypothetical protein